MKKTEKPFFVANLSEQLKSATSVVLLDYTGLTVKMQQELKVKLSEVGAQMSVIKNTLFKLAGKDAKTPSETLSDSVLTGPTAIVITEEDPIAPLQILAKFAQVNEIPKFKVGIVEGNFQDKDTLAKLSILPSKEVLFSQVVGTLAQPMYGLVSVLQGNLQKLVYILDQKSKE